MDNKSIGKSRFHTWENHWYHIGKYGHCMYCKLGSKPCSKDTVVFDESMVRNDKLKDLL